VSVSVKCAQCGVEKQVIPARAKSFKFCSYKCAGLWRRSSFRGEGNPNWTPGSRERLCQQCNKTFGWNGVTAYSVFKKRKFCSIECSVVGQIRYRGADHPKYQGNQKRVGQKRWSSLVINRDKGVCQSCGTTNVELHAHHLKPFRDYPESRLDLDNGITLCFQCHWNIHTAANENGMNSGNTLTSKVEGNPDPSLGGNIQEGVTTRGQAYRRWNGSCHWCGTFISKRLSDIKGKRHLFCSSKCAGKHFAAFRDYRPGVMDIPPTAVIPPRASCAKAII